MVTCSKCDVQGPEKTDNLVRSRLETTDYMHASNIFKLQRKELMSVEARSKTGRATEICATYHGARTKTLFRSFEDRPHFVPKLKLAFGYSYWQTKC